jgi:hypothetical protein
MDYAKIYEDFYSKYYTKTEGLIKSYFIKCKSEKRPFGHAIYKIRIHLADTILKKQVILDYNALKSAHQIFVYRFSAYESDEIQSIFANEIKIAFNKISSADLPKDYNYIKFIKDVASLTIINEILRLLQNNSPLFDRFYNLNDYQKFEIKEYGDILERTAIYIEIDSRIYPQYYLLDTESLDQQKDDEVSVNIAPSLFLNAEISKCFSDYQKKYILSFYTDYSYLKKRMESEKLIFNRTDNDFIKIIFEDLNLITAKSYDEYLSKEKLSSLKRSYSEHRENNFNIAFEGVLKK